MPTRQIDRLIFAQGGLCFFCKKRLTKSEASVEHLVASANGGNNADENCVVCCKAVNALLGSMSLKEKVHVVLNQQGQFKCPNATAASKGTAKITKPTGSVSQSHYDIVVADLKRRGNKAPKTKKKLVNTIKSSCPALSETDLSTLIEKLKSSDIIAVTGEKVTYKQT